MSGPIRPEDFGESGKLVLNHARERAVELGSGLIGTPHLFLGVVDLEDAAISGRFEDEGVRIDAVAGDLREQLAAAREVSFDATLAALEEAARAASADVPPLIEAPHLLIGVLRDSEGLVVRALREAGGDIAKLEEQLWAMLAEGSWSADAYQQRRAIQQPGIGTPAEVLKGLGRDLTAAATRGELIPLIGRDKEVRELTGILCGMRKNNAVLVGDAGVGKTAVVEGLAQRIVASEIRELEGMKIQTIEVGSLLAGTKYRGEFEDKLKRVVDEARARDDLILFIDELHTLIGAGRAEGVVADAADYLKPALSEGALKVIGATTSEEFRRHIEQDEALMRRFQEVVVQEPSRDDAVSILKGVRPSYERFHGVEIDDAALTACVDLAMRHLHGRHLPDKALDLLDRACTKERLAAAPAARPPVRAEHVVEVVSVLLEIPAAVLLPDEGERLRAMSAVLKRRVIGQDEVVDSVAKAILGAHEMNDPDRPGGVFLLLGPPGVGKTRLAEEVAAYVAGGADALVRLPMSQYATPHTVPALLGGQLTSAVRANPYSVLLLQDIDKADPAILDVLLEAFGSGELSDGTERKVDFRNTVIFMTSSIGARHIQDSRPIGFAAAEAAERGHEDVRGVVDRELERAFTPEFRGRVEPLVFRPLSKHSLRTILGVLVGEMIPMKLELGEEALDHLVEESHDPAMGARSARRTIQRLVRNPLSVMLANGEIGEHDTIAVAVSENELRFAKR